MKKSLLILVFLLTAHCSLLTAFAQGTPGTVRFPGAIDTDDSLFGNLTDGPQTTLNGTISSGATTVTVVGGGTAAFGASGSLKIDSEILYYTGKTSSTFTGVIRGRDGTTATTHASGSIVRSPILSVHHETVVNAIEAVEAKLGPGASNAADADDGDCLQAQGDGTTLWAPCVASGGAVTTFNTRAGAVTLQASDLALDGSLLTNLDPTHLSTAVPVNKGGSGATTSAGARTNFGLGSIATQSASAVNITGGSISGISYGTITATSFVGDGSGLTGTGTGTGGVINTGSTTIGADSDSNDSGVIDFQTRGTTRVRIGNTGNIALGAVALPDATLDFAQPYATTGGFTPIAFRTNEAGGSDYSIYINSTANPFHSVGGFIDGRLLHDMSIGYNIQGPRYNPDEVTVQMNWEMNYITEAGIEQAEWWIGTSAPGGGGTRPFSIDTFYQNGHTEVGINTNSFQVRDQLYNLRWGFSQTNGGASDLTVQGDSGIVYSGTREAIIGTPAGLLFGVTSGGDGVLFAGGSGYNKTWISRNAGTQTIGDTVEVAFGGADGAGSRGIKIDGTKGYFEAQNAAGDWLPIMLGTPFTGTTGSVLFVGADGLLAQDNAALFFDSTTKNLSVTGASHTYVNIKAPLASEAGFKLFETNTSAFVELYRPGGGKGFNVYLSTVGDVLQFSGVTGAMSIFDGAAIQPVTFGAADSGGSGYRLMKIPN